MVPLADLLNHDVPPSVRWTWIQDENRNGFAYHTITNVAKGQQVTLSYGDYKPNHTLLTYYGFVIPENKADYTVTIKDGKAKYEISDNFTFLAM